MGNPYPTYNGTLMKWTGGNYGLGNPVTPTTTFSGRYDVSRGGSINVTPGPRRFGGTLRLFYGPNAGWYQYIYYFDPVLYKRYGYYRCLDDGMFDCTPGTLVSEPGTTALYYANQWLLTEKGRAKATTPTTPNGKAPTPYGNASYFTTGHKQYLNLIHPWTTGFAKVHNAKGSAWRTIIPEPITPQAQGYDISLGGATISVKKRNYNQNFNKTLSTLTTNTTTRHTQVLKGVTRVVSMVRPRLVHTLTLPCRICAEPISNTWQAARLWRLTVFFLPEPGGMLMLGVGIAALLGLSRMRRR
jgi:hypothetical protein